MSPPAVVYLLCLLACVTCVLLLARAYARTGSGLLFWTALGFVFLALNNLLLVADMVVLPQADLRWARQTAALAAVAVLLFGFIREAE